MWITTYLILTERKYDMMVWHYGFCVLIVACMSKANGSTIRRSPDTGNTQGFYPNNPFLNSSIPEQYRHNHYNGHHHHHHHPDFYHNHNHNHNDEMPNFDDGFPEDESGKDFLDNDYPDQVDDGPKTTTRRQVTDDESVPEYPYSEIRSLLDQNPLLKQYFAAIPKLGNRDGVPDDEGESLCKTQTVRTYHPQKLKNINQVERTIVNDKKEYVQAIEEKRCANDRRPCNIPFDAFGYTSYCHQNFDIKRLMVYENSTKKVVFDEFKVASCCVCKIHKNK